MFPHASNIVINNGSFSVQGTPQAPGPPQQVTHRFLLPDERNQCLIGSQDYKFQAPGNAYIC